MSYAEVLFECHWTLKLFDNYGIRKDLYLGTNLDMFSAAALLMITMFSLFSLKGP